jgi:hypothetical protein
MSSASEPQSGSKGDLSESRHTNENKSVKSSEAGSDGSALDLYTRAKIDRCVSEFVESYPDKAMTPVATGDRRQLREKYADIEYEEWQEDLRMPEDEYKSLMYPNSRPSGRTKKVSVPVWADVLEQLLYNYAKTQETTVRLRLGEKPMIAGNEDPRPVYDVDAKTRWGSDYQKKYKAQLDGWLRELTGGERPSGKKTDAGFEDPHIALISVSGSSTPDGGRIGPVDLLSELNSTWSNHTYHAVRNTLRTLGFESDEWQYDRRAEPHTGKRGNKAGINACYGHEHIILVIDGEVTADELRPIVEKHVEKCDYAGPSAHGEDAIEVRKPDDLTDVSAYVADYASISPTGLLDREPEFQAFAAAAAAANYRTVTRSEAAKEAAQVDRCKQRYESAEAAQSVDHGDSVYYDKRDGTVRCAECECAHDVNQEQTIGRHRIDSNDDETGIETPVCDGGCKPPTDESRRQELQEQWQDANAAATLGEPSDRTKVRRRIQMVKDAHPGKDAVELAAMFDAMGHIDVVRQVLNDHEDLTNYDKPVGFGQDKEPEWMDPEWQVDAVVVNGEEESAASGNGMSYVETTNYVNRFGDVIDNDHWYRCECGVRVYGHEMAKHLGHSHGIETVKQARVSVEREVHD